jgi:hypothetical protein
LVWTADAGIKKNAAIPTAKVIMPSIKNSHLAITFVKNWRSKGLQIDSPPTSYAVDTV